MQLAASLNTALRHLPTGMVHMAGLVPAFWIFGLALLNRLGPEPVEVLLHSYGLWGLQFLLAALAVTPLRRMTGVNLLRFRRTLGLLAFWYVAAHLAVWLLLDVQLDWGEIWKGLTERPFIMLGMAGFAILLPLAATSSDRAIRALGPATWNRLHMLAHVAALAGGAHYLLLVKAWPLEPILYLGGALILAFLRLLRERRRTGRASRAA
ncbi:MAG: protein-methionine-sulfoxide reductase heme-binding subunit MsrQ [Rhodobacteraceae bacterium]|nr:protein-methionine-sulfoxide reductase heme-binding subunit MsrQ [Paracoccaceae bacterium]